MVLLGEKRLGVLRNYHGTTRMLCRSDADRQRSAGPVRHRSRYDSRSHRAHSDSESDAVS